MHILGPDRTKPSAQTQVSHLHKAQEPGRKSITSAITSGGFVGGFKVLDNT